MRHAGEQAPTLTIAGDPNTGSAPWILELGIPCEALIVEAHPLELRNPRGDDLYAFMLSVSTDGRPPYRIQTGFPVPAAALPLVRVGNTVPAKRMPSGDDRELVIDWEPALAQLAAGRRGTG
jgi:hypothetical protein